MRPVPRLEGIPHKVGKSIMEIPGNSVDALRKSSKLRWIEDHVRESARYGSVMFGVTLYAVFMDDIRLACMPKDLDVPYIVLLMTCFVMFLFDIFMSVLFEPKYTKQVMFFLDTIATASMPLQLALESGDSNTLALGRLARLVRILRVIRIMRVARFASKATDLAMDDADKKRREAGRTESTSSGTDMIETPTNDETPGRPRKNSELGLGISEVINSVRGDDDDDTTDQTLEESQEMRVAIPKKDRRDSGGAMIPARFVKKMSTGVMQTAVTAAKTAASVTGLQKADDDDDDDDDDTPRGSAIGQTLVTATTSKIVLLVLVLAVGFELLDNTQPNVAPIMGIALLDDSYDTYNTDGCFTAPGASVQPDTCEVAGCCSEFNDLVLSFISDLKFDGCSVGLRKLTVGGKDFLAKSTGDLRNIEMLKVKKGSSEAWLDISAQTALTSAWSLTEIILIMTILLFFPYIFGKDVLTIVVTPLEIIFDRVQQISTNPFAKFDNTSVDSDSYELDMVKRALLRLTKLLQVGLGPAASGIISKNLQAGQFSAMQSGSKVNGVFGFIYIRDFTDCCEELQEDCVLFVNTIAGIVSRAVGSQKGAVNKNLGMAFLTNWKCGQNDEADQAYDYCADLTEAAERALQSFIDVVETVRESESVQQYGFKMRNSSFISDPNYTITIGCGLHQGWAIEGAVGSEQKIDATYLSPNVNLSARLMSGTKFYGVPVLMSHWFFDHLSPTTKGHCRMVDRVAVKGSIEPMTISTYIFETDDPHKAEAKSKSCQEYFDLYIAGKWEECRKILDAFLVKYPNDGPAQAISKTLEESNDSAPSDWEGYKKLTAK